jgi:hypothetical protein
VQNRVGNSVSIVTLPLLATHTMSARTQLALHPDRGEFLHRMQLAGVGDVHCCVCWRSLTEGLLFFCFLGIPCLMVWTTLDNLVTPHQSMRTSQRHTAVWEPKWAGVGVTMQNSMKRRRDELATPSVLYDRHKLNSHQRSFITLNTHWHCKIDSTTPPSCR